MESSQLEVFQGIGTSPVALLYTALRQAEERIQLLQTSREVHDTTLKWNSLLRRSRSSKPTFFSWEFPLPGCIKINFDGPLDQASGMGGSGFLAQNVTREFMGGKSLRRHGDGNQ